MHLEILDLRKEFLGQEDPDVADTLAGLGILYLNTSRYLEAVYYLTRALELREIIFGQYDTYVFEVDKKATKVDIKNAIESMYNVVVKKVNTMNLGGGKKEMKHTNKGIIFQRTKAVKKAMITLADGDEIDFYSNI